MDDIVLSSFVFRESTMTGELFCLILACVLGPSCGRVNANIREKRNIFYPPPLVYPFGGTIKLVIGFAVPVHLAGRILVYGQNFQFQYALPQNATFFSNLLENGRDGSSRRRRDLDANGRAFVFDAIEQNFRRNGLDGRECLRKSICEAAVDPLINEGLMGELLHLLLTPEHSEDPSFPQDFLQAAEAAKNNKDCSVMYPSCPDGHGFLDRISRIIT